MRDFKERQRNEQRTVIPRRRSIKEAAVPIISTCPPQSRVVHTHTHTHNMGSGAALCCQCQRLFKRVRRQTVSLAKFRTLRIQKTVHVIFMTSLKPLQRHHVTPVTTSVCCCHHNVTQRSKSITNVASSLSHYNVGYLKSCHNPFATLCQRHVTFKTALPKVRDPRFKAPCRLITVHRLFWCLLRHDKRLGC